MSGNKRKTDMPRQEYRTKVIQVGNVTVTLRRPVLSDAERISREEQVKRAILNLAEAAEPRQEPILEKEA